MKALSFTVLVSILAAQAAQAGPTGNHIYVTIEGMRQGKFRAEVTNPRHAGTIEALRLNYGVTAPRDPGTGLVTGRRVHSPLVITKEWGAASPQLFTAVFTNETLKTVKLEFVRPTPAGEEEIYSTITLSGGNINFVKQTEDNLGATPSDRANLQDVSFSFQKIEMTDSSGSSAIDDVQHPL